MMGTGVATGLGLLYTVVAQRWLGPVQSADFVAALSLVSFCQIALGPINGTVARFTAQYADRKELGRVRALARMAFRHVTGWSLVCFGLGALAAQSLAGFLQFQSRWSLVLAFGMVALTLVLSVSRGVLRGLSAFGSLNANTIAEALVRVILGLAILWAAMSAGGALVGYLAGVVAALALSAWQLPRHWTGQSPEAVDAKGILRYAAPLLVMMMVTAGFENIDMLAVKRFADPIDAGIYGAAFTLARSMAALVTPFATLLLPLLTVAAQQGKAITGPWMRIAGYFLFLAGPVWIAFALWSEPIVSMLFGDEFAPAGSILALVAMARLLGYLGQLAALALCATGRFGFLYLYAPTLMLEAAALMFWHDSLMTVAWIATIGNGAALIALCACVSFLRIKRAEP